MVDIALGKPLSNSAGLHSTDYLVKHDFADWSLNGIGIRHVVGSEEITHSWCSSTDSC